MVRIVFYLELLGLLFFTALLLNFHSQHALFFNFIRNEKSQLKPFQLTCCIILNKVGYRGFTTSFSM